MTSGEILAILAAATGAGAINAVVGSGSLITFPTLLAFGFPPVIANVSNNTGFANANKDATPLLHPTVMADAAVYPTADQQQRLLIQTELTPEQTRAITRLWQKFKTGQ